MKYAAFFRGINVGGKNIVKMAELKDMLESLDFTEVRTYIQSGNAVFETNDDGQSAVGKLRARFQDVFGFDAMVTLRDEAELAAILGGLPFSKDELSDAESSNPHVEHLYVYLLDTAVPADELERIRTAYSGKDRISVAGHELYLLCYQSVRDSKLAAALAKLNRPMTARNWKTIGKMYNLMITR